MLGIRRFFKRNPEHALLAGLYMLAVFYFMFDAYFAPFRNWDMVAYVGVVKQASIADYKEMYEATLSEIKEVMSAGHYHKTTTQNLLSNNADVFWQQLPHYHIKPLYTALVAGLDALGVNTARATWLVANLCFGLLGLTLAFWKPQRVHYALWLAAVLLLCQFGFLPMRALAHFSTPDSLCIFLTLASFIGWMGYKNYGVFAVCGLLAMAARPDSLILVAGFAIFFTFFARDRMKLADGAMMLAGCVTTYLIIDTILPSHSWQKYFYYSYVYKIPSIAVSDVSLSWEQYWKVELSLWKQLWELPRIRIIACMSAFALAAFAWRREAREYAWLLAGLWAGFMVHFAITPSIEERYYYGFYLLMVIASLELTASLSTRKGHTL